MYVLKWTSKSFTKLSYANKLFAFVICDLYDSIYFREFNSFINCELH